MQPLLFRQILICTQLTKIVAVKISSDSEDSENNSNTNYIIRAIMSVNVCAKVFRAKQKGVARTAYRERDLIASLQFWKSHAYHAMHYTAV